MTRLSAFLFLLLFVPLAVGVEMAVIGHPSVPFATLSRSTVANLFLVSPAIWGNGMPAVPFDLVASGSEKARFYQEVIGRPLFQINTYRARQIFSGTGIPPMEVDSVAEMIRRVATTEGAVGYVPRDRIDGSVRVLTITP